MEAESKAWKADTCGVVRREIHSRRILRSCAFHDHLVGLDSNAVIQRFLNDGVPEILDRTRWRQA